MGMRRNLWAKHSHVCNYLQSLFTWYPSSFLFLRDLLLLRLVHFDHPNPLGKPVRALQHIFLGSCVRGTTTAHMNCTAPMLLPHPPPPTETTTHHTGHTNNHHPSPFSFL